MKKLKSFRRKSRANSNRGGALLPVIIVMAVAGILGALVLSIAYTNFTMKNVDRKSKNNFYSAEMVVEEICAGLQKEVSTQYKRAYTTTMENYGTYDSADLMQDDFNTQFVLNMVGVLKEGSSQSLYKVETLKNYVNAANYPQGTYTVTSQENTLDTLEDGLCIRNLEVSYQEGGYINTITTDIKIATPEVGFARISMMPDVADYSFIAQEGLLVNGGAAWNLEGKAFAGVKRNADGEVTNPVSIQLQAGSSLDASDASSTLMVSEGTIELTAKAKLTTGSSTSLWADSLNAEASAGATVAGNIVSLNGRTYMKDDTTLSGSGNELYLGGQYYGYSNDDADASKSSAIIINGTETTLDMSSLDTLVLAGTAFVGTKGETYSSSEVASGLNTNDILMGDSIAIKGNQFAYMVPVECEGIVVNPMSYAQYQKLTEDSYWKTKALNTILSGIRRSIASYGDVDITPVFTNKSGGAVYLYLDFHDSNVASQYFMDYYNANTTGNKVEEYLNKYLSVFQFNTNGSGSGMSRLVTQGNYLVPATYSGATLTPVYTGNTADVATIAQELVNYSSSYKALCTKLVENMSSLTSEEFSGTVFSNLIDEEKIEQFFGAYATNSQHSDNVIFSIDAGGAQIATLHAEDGAAGTGICAIIVNNAGKAAYTVPAGGSGIIIATGDVSLGIGSQVGWDGLIICKGKLSLTGGSSTNPVTIRADADATSKAMQLICSVGSDTIEEGESTTNYAVLNFFKGGGNYTLGFSSGNADAKVDVRDCLSYENWKSE